MLTLASERAFGVRSFSAESANQPKTNALREFPAGTTGLHNNGAEHRPYLWRRQDPTVDLIRKNWLEPAVPQGTAFLFLSKPVPGLRGLLPTAPNDERGSSRPAHRDCQFWSRLHKSTAKINHIYGCQSGSHAEPAKMPINSRQEL